MKQCALFISKIIILYFLFCGCTVFKPKKIVYFDSIYIKIDTIRISTKEKTYDSVHYQKTDVKISKTPKYTKIRNGIFYVILIAVLIYLKFG